MITIERNLKLKQEADFLLENLKLISLLSQSGKVTFTGSYYLDLMIYPDIDLYVSKVPIDKIFKITSEITNSDLVSEVRFHKEDKPPFNGGLYLKFYLNYGDWKRPWKIDIWFLEDKVIDEQMKEMHRFKEKLTPELKEKILAYKFSIINKEHRTPMYSGYFIYKAFIDKELTDFDEVTKYLKANKIKVE
jgi:hypothetical protein